MIEDLHRRHAAAGRKVQPDHGAIRDTILLGPSMLTHSTLDGAPSCSAVCTGPAVCVAQLPIWPVPKSRNPRQLYGTY